MLSTLTRPVFILLIIALNFFKDIVLGIIYDNVKIVQLLLIIDTSVLACICLAFLIRDWDPNNPSNQNS